MMASKSQRLPLKKVRPAGTFTEIVENILWSRMEVGDGRQQDGQEMSEIDEV
jgi:hypothetical protein